MSSTLKTRVLAGVTIPDTLLVNTAIKFARDHLDDVFFHHVMRTFLFSSVIASKSPDYKNIDLEALAVSGILHDIGFDKTGELVSQDKRFEVDGAIAARDFLHRQAPDWDKHRVQLVWDAVALHSTTSIVLHKEPEVAVCSLGVTADFGGPKDFPDILTWSEYNAIVQKFPRLNLSDGMVTVISGFCRTKPGTTYDNYQHDIGNTYVEGYSNKGHTYVVIISYIFTEPFSLTSWQVCRSIGQPHKATRLKTSQSLLSSRYFCAFLNCLDVNWSVRIDISGIES